MPEKKFHRVFFVYLATNIDNIAVNYSNKHSCNKFSRKYLMTSGETEVVFPSQGLIKNEDTLIKRI